jgi:hypothetical protein
MNATLNFIMPSKIPCLCGANFLLLRACQDAREPLPVPAQVLHRFQLTPGQHCKAQNGLIAQSAEWMDGSHTKWRI